MEATPSLATQDSRPVPAQQLGSRVPERLPVYRRSKPLRLMLDIDFAKEEAASSNISTTSKILLNYILDGALLSAGDPLFGLML